MQDPHCALPDIEEYDESYCAAFKEWEAVGSAGKTYAAIAIVLVNIVVKMFIRKTVNLEKAHSKGAQHASVALRIFVASLFNTALLIIIMRTDTTISAAIVDTLTSVVTGFSTPEAFESPTYKWYSAIGQPYYFTMFIVRTSGLLVQ